MKEWNIFLLMFFFAAGNLCAGGMSDMRLEYEQHLSDTFTQVVSLVSSGELTAAEGKQKLEELRSEYLIAYSDESGIMDSLIDDVAEDRLETGEALHFFSLLMEGRLMEFRREQERLNIFIFEKELFASLTLLFDDFESGFLTTAGLRDFLNDFYAEANLEYNDTYTVISRLITQFEKNEITFLQFRDYIEEYKISILENGPESDSGKNNAGEAGGAGSRPGNQTGTDSEDQGNKPADNTQQTPEHGSKPQDSSNVDNDHGNGGNNSRQRG